MAERPAGAGRSWRRARELASRKGEVDGPAA